MKQQANARFNQKQKHIMRTALEIIARKGYNGASVRDIALASNVNLAMINYYFGSKAELLVAIFEEMTEQAKSYIDTYIMDDSLSPIEKLEKMIEGYTRFAFENKHFMALLIRQQLLGGHDKIDDYVYNLKFRYLRILSSALEEAKKKQQFNPQANITTINAIVMGSINLLISDQKFLSRAKEGDWENDDIYYAEVVLHTVDQIKSILRTYLLDTSAKV